MIVEGLRGQSPPLSSTKETLANPDAIIDNMTCTDIALESSSLEWPAEDCTRIPNWVYSDPANYRMELEKIFYGPFWSFIGLECEVPNPGDYKRAVVGERSVVMVRDKDGGVNVLLNSCAHRSAEVCLDKFGSNRVLMCPYHQWTYDLKGKLIGVPFRKGVKGIGGYPAGFDMQAHSLSALRVEVVNGAVFATFHHNALPMKEYLGEQVYEKMTRVFNGRKLKVLGYQRQRLRGNWKLYPENLKDSYHATLLHVFLISFGLYRMDQKGNLLNDERTRSHNVTESIATRPDDLKAHEEMKSFKSNLVLNDMRPVTSVKEFQDDITLQNLTMFPCLTIQQQQNLLQCRNVIPIGPDEFELSWTFFGYEDDDEEMTLRRIRLANLIGAAGYISLDDNEVFELSAAGMKANPERNCVVELGGATSDTPLPGEMVSESAIRGFYELYREVMYGHSRP